ncbi:nucleotidyltransferase family protein [Winogradskyella bathintestinalis]|uniref:Nucleotidyltransferase family protein n=1 Tax=Winogradskyella bathintestinalis TaxID=3035208 RepID=A0ABT7ZSN3_9FLAO|nr:nucleotidyltransferase family protein [Winogradskyella bathintestinalis]MDN3492034.1 nucleotidyltransferase family protein [Winogradskyella bathintestinalis]
MNNFAITYQHIADILSFEVSASQLEQTLSDPSFDWDDIVQEGSKHFVIPAIYCRLKAKQLLHVLPEDLISYLEYVTDENRKRNEIILIQTQAISQLLNAHKIEHVFLKGTALLLSGCFNDLAERMLGDIDLIVNAQQINEAYTLLCDNGYIPYQQTLGHQFFEHKHLPRLETEVSSTRIAAVEVHSKLFVNYNYDNLNNILRDKRQHNTTNIPSQEHLLMHTILNFQINDQGALYNSISFRPAYDAIVLLQNYSGSKPWYALPIIKNFFRYTGLFFKDITTATHIKPNIFNHFYLFKLQHIRFYKCWNYLLNLGHLIPILLKRGWLFISNSAYRKAIIRDRHRILAHFRQNINFF